MEKFWNVIIKTGSMLLIVNKIRRGYDIGYILKRTHPNSPRRTSLSHSDGFAKKERDFKTAVFLPFFFLRRYCFEMKRSW